MRRWAAALGVFFAGCGGLKSGDVPSIRYGVDSCARCGMAISEERFAAGYVDAQGRSIVFDDVGEFLVAVRLQPSLARSSFVHDAQDGRWLHASAAFFVRVAGLGTPMGTGFAAFASGARAKSFSERLGKEGVPMRLLAAVAAAAGEERP